MFRLLAALFPQLRPSSAARATLTILLLLVVSADAGAAETTADRSLTASFTDCDVCPTMVIVAPGTGWIGSGPDAFDRRPSERPRRQATIEKPFAMAEHEVTRAQFAAFVSAAKYSPPRGATAGKLAPEGCNYWNGVYGYVSELTWRNPGFLQRDDEPVLCVSYADAEAYARWLTRRTGRDYRVPSLVEFEFASRAGSEAAWFWGNSSEEACKYANIADWTYQRRWAKRQQFNCDDNFEYTSSAKRFAPNAYGLYDTVGNAWEWTADCWHDDLSGGPIDGRPWLAEDGGDCEYRTPAGGGWVSGPGWARAAARSKDPAVYRSFMLGFRVAAAADKTTVKTSR